MKRDVTPALTLAPQQISLDVLREKYLKPGEETSMDLFRRVARSLASAEPQAERALWEERFLVNLERYHAGEALTPTVDYAAGY